MKNSKLWGIISILLVFGLVFAACGDLKPDELIDAVVPEITAQPVDGSRVDIGTSITLSVTATVSDGGTLEHQWYSNTRKANADGTAIPGETGTSYTATGTVARTSYFYVVVTNNNRGATGKKTASVASNAVSVIFKDPDAADVREILYQPQGGKYYSNDTLPALTVTVEPGAGTLTYQWYSNTSAANTGGAVIAGATNASYTPTGTVAGTTYYYYVVVTNTEAGKTRPSSVTSELATIAVGTTSNPYASLTPNLTVTVNNTTKGQFIRGVGGMSDQCFIYGNGSWTDRVTLDDIQNMFGHGAQELGLNMYRLLMYPYLEEGIEYTGPKGALTPGNPDQGIVDDTTLYRWGSTGSKSGTRDQDQSDYYNIIKKINEMDGYVMLCPWIIPLEYTTNRAGTAKGSGTGGGTNVDRTKFNELADWYVDYIRNLVNHGAPIFALSVQNEPDQGVLYDGCIWSGDDQRDLIRILGPKLAASGLKGYGGGRVWDKIWIATGENAGLPGAAGDSAINDTGASGASQYVEIATRHLYGSSSPYTNGITAIADSAKGLKEIWQTEHCDTTNAGRDNYYGDMSGWNWVWHIANETYNTFALNKESAFIWWTSKRFYGFLGEGNFTTSNGAVLPRGHVMAHFGKYVLNTNMISVTATGNFVSNEGTNAAAGTSGLTGTTLPVAVGTNLNPSAFTHGNNDTAGQNQPTTKVMAFEADDGSYISVVAFTATRNSGAGGQNAGNVRIQLPTGFAAAGAELMRSNATAKQQIEMVPMNSTRTEAIINLPRNEIVSVKFTRAR